MITSRRTRDGKPIMDIEYTTSVETPHVPWAKPLAGGPVKAFFLPSVKGGRDYVELMQRLELDVTAVTHDRAWDLDKWGFGDFYDRRVRIWEYETVYGYMIDALTSDEKYDVLVLQSVNGWGFWPREARRAILERVRKGAGLVLVRPFEGEKKAPELAQVSPLVGCPNDTVDKGGYAVIARKSLRSAPWQPARRHYITNNFPFDAVPYDEIAYYPYKAKGDVIIATDSGDPIAATGKFGKGRVVAFGWYNRDLVPQHRDHAKPSGGLSSNSDFWAGGFSRCTWRYVEYIHSMLAKAVVWAARRDEDRGLSLKAAGGSSPSLRIDLKGPRESIELQAIIRNEWGSEEARISRSPEELGAGTVSLDLPAETLAAGAHLAEVIVRRDGKSVDWGTLRFDTPRRATMESITTDREIHAPADKVKATVKIAGEGGEVRMEAAIVDAFDRITARAFRNVTPGETVKLTLSRKGVLTPQMWVRVQITDNGRIIDERKSARLTAVPDYDRALHDAELVVAQYDRGRGDYVEVVRRQLLKFGATGGYYGYSKLLAESGAEGGGVYWYHRAPYVERKEKFLRTGDKKYLERVPCLSDPAFRRKIHDKIVKTAAKGTRYAPLSYYVQDEGSLTCYTDQYDVCFGKHTLAAMREWLKKEYRDIRRLNKQWGTKFRSWGKVVPMTLDEARTHGNLAPWADHRTFMETVFADYLKLVRDSVRELDADARVRLSGCQTSTPYSGMDYWRLHQVVEYFEAYSGGNQFEFHQSFAGPRTILGTWIGYGQKGRASKHRIWDSFFHQIRLFSVFWEYAVVDPDFGLSGSAEDMSATWKTLHDSGVSRMLFDAERDNSGIAVHYSFPSIHATFGEKKFDRLTAARQGWLNILQQFGYQQTFLSRQQIEAGDLISRKFKALILPLSIALSPKEARAIKRFVRAGGRLIADYQTAVMDDHCTRLEAGQLDDVFGIKRFNMRNEPFYINREPRRTENEPKISAIDVQE
ncbi:MAG: beta-galactosidase, partial [Planctomycetota bacterium]